MLTLIVFMVKLVIAIFSGIFLGYTNKKFNSDENILPLVMLTVIISIAFSVSSNTEIFFLGSIFLVHSITKTYKLSIKLFYFSTCIVGLLVGNGDILELLFLCIVIFSVNNNRESIENFFSDSEEKIEKE